MSFISQWFKFKSRTPAWQHADRDVRRQALPTLSDEQLLAFIAVESDAELRQAAVALIRSPKALTNLLNTSFEDVRQRARQLLLEHYLPNESALEQITDSDTLLNIASWTEDADLRLKAIGRIEDAVQLLDLACNHSLAKVRLAAAERLDSPEQWQQLADHAQNKDKAVYRLAKERLTHHKAQQQAQRAQLAQIEQLLDQARYLNKVGYHPEFNGKLTLLNKQWPELRALANLEQQQQIDTELAQAQALLVQHAQEEQAAAAQRAAQLNAKAVQSALLDKVNEVFSLARQNPLDTALTDIELWQQQWQESLQDHQPSASEREQFHDILQALRALGASLSALRLEQDRIHTHCAQVLPTSLVQLKQDAQQSQQWLTDCAWPEGFALPEPIANLQQRLETVQRALNEQFQAQKAHTSSAQQLLEQLEHALDQGQIKEATRCSQQFNKLLREVDQAAAQRLQRRFRSLQARLKELRDWAGFATSPKKEALVEAMQALIGAPLSPDVLADKIHRLQEEWKALGNTNHDQSQWQLFQQAADAAFEPCKAYFNELAQQRAHNLTAREQLISELIHYEAAMDWDNADWPTVQKTLEQARETFRALSPVERQHHLRTSEAFKHISDAIYVHLKQELDRVGSEKKALVDAMATLAARDDLTNISQEVKALQAQWKALGATSKGLDGKLWSQFRKHCDTVFKRLDDTRTERRAQQDTHIQQAQDAVEQALALAQTQAEQDALLTLRNAQQALQNSQLPKGAEQRLNKRLTQQIQTVQKQLHDQQQEAQQQRWQGLLARIEHLRSPEDAWQAACTLPLPQGYNQALFEQARQQAPNHEENATDLCILMEIVANLDSIEADKTRRMQLQVQRLAAGLGQLGSPEQERQQLLTRWLTLAPDASLQQRFLHAFKQTL